MNIYSGIKHRDCFCALLNLNLRWVFLLVFRTKVFLLGRSLLEYLALTKTELKSHKSQVSMDWVQYLFLVTQNIKKAQEELKYNLTTPSHNSTDAKMPFPNARRLSFQVSLTYLKQFLNFLFVKLVQERNKSSSTHQKFQSSNTQRHGSSPWKHRGPLPC